MSSIRYALPLIGLLTAALSVPALAADMPKRKSGLWEIKAEHDGMPGMTMQMCIDANQDDMTAQEADKTNREVRKMCSKMDIKQSGGRMVIDSVCKMGNVTATGHTEISGQMSSQYRMESITLFNPPMQGMSKSRSVMNGRWLGPCPAGQRHGSVNIVGMPGGGQFQMDPKMIEQMRKMREQSGR